MNVAILLHLLNLLFVVNSQQQPKTCFGSEPRELPDGCTVVDTKPMIFKGNEDDSTVRHKVQYITDIKSGIEIIGTDYESFDFFNGTLLTLRNPNGPALILQENRKLKRIHFDHLTELNGKEHAILLDKTSFSKSAADDDGISFHDLMKLEALTRSADDGKACSTKFAKVVPYENVEGSGVLPIILWILAGICLVAMIVLAIWFIRTFKSYKKEKAAGSDKKPTAKDGKKAEPTDAKNGGPAADGGGGEEKPPSLQGNVNEDPKKK